MSEQKLDFDFRSVWSMAAPKPAAAFEDPGRDLALILSSDHAATAAWPARPARQATTSNRVAAAKVLHRRCPASTDQD